MEDVDWNQLLPGYVWKPRNSKSWAELMPAPSTQLSYLLPKNFEGSCAVHAYSEALTVILRWLVNSKDISVDLGKLIKICVDNGVLTATGTTSDRFRKFVNNPSSAIPLEGSLPADYVSNQPDLIDNPLSLMGTKLKHVPAKPLPFGTPTPEEAKEAMDYRELLCFILDSFPVIICFPLQKHYQEQRDGGAPYRLRQGEENYVKRSRKSWFDIGWYFGLFGNNERLYHCTTAFAYDCPGGDVRSLRIFHQENAIWASGSQPGAIHPDQSYQPGRHVIDPDAIESFFVPLVTEQSYFCKTPNNHPHKNLHSIGGLGSPLGYFKNSNVGIRAKAHKAVSKIVENNPKSQKLVMESNGLEQFLTNFKSDPSTNARTKALGAISCNSLIRHSQPGISAFRMENGYAGLKDALGSDDARFQRKELNLLQYLLRNKADKSVARELGLPKLMMHLASSDDSLVRDAAPGGLLELALGKTSGNALPDQDHLKDILKSRIEGLSAMDSDELHAAHKERQLVDSLWMECYNEPSSLREKGLAVLPGEDNPKSQKLVMQSNGLEQLLTNFKSDPNTNARTKALGAISCNSLIRHSQPGISAFRVENGYAGLKDALGSDDARFQRKELKLLQYLLHNKADKSVARELGLLNLMMHLASSDDSLVLEAALGDLLELAQDKTPGNALPDQDHLKDILKSRIEGLSAMDSDELHAAREERQLVDSLWKECYNEPSSLRENCLAVLPAEDAPQQPPPDVARKMLEPPLRAWASARPVQEDDSESGSGKKDPPLMLKF